MKWFLNSGRVFSGLFFGVVNQIDIIKIVPVISILFSVIILTVTIYIVYKNVVKWCSVDNYLKKLIVLMTIVLVFYNPFMLEILVFDESFIICFGILFCILGAIAITKTSIKNYIKAFIYGILAIICYQGIIGYFAIFSLLFVLLSAKDSICKKALKAILVYAVSMAVSLLLIMLFGFAFGTENAHLGNVEIITNLKTIVSIQLPEVINHSFGYVNSKIFIGLIIILFINYIVICCKNKKIDFYFLALIILSIIVTFLPNLFTSADTNYIAARMCLCIGILPGMLGLYLVVNSSFSDNKYICIIVVIILLGYFIYNSYNFLTNNRMNLKRYNFDMTELAEIYKRIDKYEKENIKVKTIYYAYDQDSLYYYNFGKNNGLSIRLLSVGWGTECAINAYSDSQYKYLPMDEKKKKEYFGNKNYDTIDDAQFVFDHDKLYMLIY